MGENIEKFNKKESKPTEEVDVHSLMKEVERLKPPDQIVTEEEIKISSIEKEDGGHNKRDSPLDANILVGESKIKITLGEDDAENDIKITVKEDSEISDNDSMPDTEKV